MKNILFLLFAIANSISGQNADSLFVSANELYRNGAFEEAIKKYKEIETLDAISSELYLNIGNAHYKLNKVGPTIFYYEKALKLDPLNTDVKNNLIFAQRLALDNIKEVPKTVFQKLNKNYLQRLSFDEWAVVVVSFSFLTAILFLLFYFGYSPTKKKNLLQYKYLQLYTVTFFAFLLHLVNTIRQKIKKEAIVFAEKTAVRNAPTLNSEEVFILHEGAKVIVLDAIDNWKKIKLADGKQGWIISEEIKEF